MHPDEVTRIDGTFFFDHCLFACTCLHFTDTERFLTFSFWLNVVLFLLQWSESLLITVFRFRIGFSADPDYEGRPSYRKSLQPSKENIQSNTSKFNFFLFFSIFVDHFCPPGSGSILPKSMRIRIRNTGWFVVVSRWAQLSRSWCSTTCWTLLILVTLTQSSTSRAGPCPSWNVCSGEIISCSPVPFYCYLKPACCYLPYFWVRLL